jgi:hypothetical protein
MASSDGAAGAGSASGVERASSSPSLLASFFIHPPPRSTGPPVVWEEYPRRLLSYGFAVAEAVQAGGVPLDPWVRGALSAVTGAYLLGTALERRAEVGEDLGFVVDLVRRAKNAAAADAVLTGWMETVTLPSIAVGAVAAAVKRAAPAAPPAARAAATLASLPLLMPACAHAAGAVMEWAGRPAIEYFARPPESAALPSADYIAPLPEELLSGIGGGGQGGGGGGGGMLGVGLLPPDLDPLERARLEWALDGNLSSPYPEAGDAVGARVAAAHGAGAGAKAAAGTATAVGGEEEYMKAVAAIRANADARAARAVAAGPAKAGGGEMR